MKELLLAQQQVNDVRSAILDARRLAHPGPRPTFRWRVTSADFRWIGYAFDAEDACIRAFTWLKAADEVCKPRGLSSIVRARNLDLKTTYYGLALRYLKRLGMWEGPEPR